MDFNRHNLQARWLAMAVVAVLLPAVAQQSGQPIIFSAPQKDDWQSLVPSNPSRAATLSASLPPPVTVFDFDPTSDLPPPPPPNPSGSQPMNQLLDERKNWIFMTPEEILGVTPQKNLLTGSDAMGDKNQTQLERYLERDGQLQNSVTNNWLNKQADSPWSFSRNADNAAPLDSQRADALTQSWNQLLNGQRSRADAANQARDSSWSAFSRPVPPTVAVPDLEQQAAMDRFRQLLTPGSAPDTTAPDNGLFSVPKAVLDPFIDTPDFVVNPAGASFTPLSSGIAKPMGLTPLPGAVTTLPLVAPVPGWKPQPAPWLRTGPQPFVMPQPKGF